MQIFLKPKNLGFVKKSSKSQQQMKNSEMFVTTFCRVIGKMAKHQNTEQSVLSFVVMGS